MRSKLNELFRLAYVITFAIALVITPMSVIKADSGFDSSYSGGGSSFSSSGSSSSYSSGSSYHSSSSYSSSGGSYDDGDEFAVFMFILIFVIVVAVIFSATQGSSSVSSSTISKVESVLDGMSQEEISAIDPDIKVEEMLDYTFDLYVKIQEAWMNFDYETLESTLTNELYNNYKMLLEQLDLKGEQNIMKDFVFHGGSIKSIEKVGNKETIVMGLKVAVVDYICNRKTQARMRGSQYPITIAYHITLVKEDNTVVKYCPNCGAELDEKNHTECKYCNSIITGKTSNFVMSKKEAVGQW